MTLYLVLSKQDAPPSEEEVNICENNFFFGLPLSNKVLTGKHVYIAIERADLFL